MSTHPQTFLVPMTQPNRPIYLDCAATTPIDPRVRAKVLHYMDFEFGNAGSRTHQYGQEAANAVKHARRQIAAVVEAKPGEVLFTSGATEANNLALLGLAEYGKNEGKRHIISTQIEHKAVLEPLKFLQSEGFEIDLIPPSKTGQIDPNDLQRYLREDTLLVTIMHVNNETGIVQPIGEIAAILENHSAIYHVDAAQGFAKELNLLSESRIDLISVSGHKIHGPMGIGALIARQNGQVHRKLSPLTFGGGQERGLRPGTLPVPLIVGFGEAAEIAVLEHEKRLSIWSQHRKNIISALDGLPYRIHGESANNLGNIVNFSISDLDSDVVILALKNIASISSGSACTASKSFPSHVISAMYPESELASMACRASWSHLTPPLDPVPIRKALDVLI